jgi:poly(A) polymerase
MSTPKLPGDPLIIPRTEHCISRKNIDPDALKVMRRLIRYGHKAYLVGGGVRDLLLGKQPKDFDVSTDARPEEVRTLFRNSRIIGRRFRLNHVYFRGNKIIELSTFRASSEDDETSVDGEGKMLVSDNTFGDPQTDSVRRDLTINGLFYDLNSFSLIDYVGGIEDLNNKIIRIIGDPLTRFQEDPVRMIRAVRHAVRAGFRIEEVTYNCIVENRELLSLASSARVHDEFLKELRGGESFLSIRLLNKVGLLPFVMPVLAESLEEAGKSDAATAIWSRVEHTLRSVDAFSRKSREEIPSAVLLLAPLIGNVPRRMLEALAQDKKNLPFLQHFMSSPAELDAESTLEKKEGEESPLNPLKLAPGDSESARRRARKKGVSRLGKIIAQIFEGSEVSRKDRERMEQLLIARSVLLSNKQSRALNSLRNKSYYQDAILLLHLTAHTPEADARLLELTEGGTPEKKPKKRRRRKPRKTPTEGSKKDTGSKDEI